MKKIVKITIYFFLVVATFVACNKEKSLQQYFVEKNESNNFLSFDIPAGVLNLSENASVETKETIASLKKLNVLVFKINDVNKSEYDRELEDVKNIIKNDKFIELIRVKHEKANIIVKYLGTEEAIDELIVLASDKSKGFALARILGNKMQPEKIMKLVKNMDQVSKDSAVFSQLEGIFNGMI